MHFPGQPVRDYYLDIQDAAERLVRHQNQKDEPPSPNLEFRHAQ